MDIHYLSQSEDFIEIFYLHRFRCTLRESATSLEIKDLHHTQKGDYKSAYKKSQKTVGSLPQDIPAELVEIVAVWRDLPVHIKAAIKVLVQTCKKGVE